MKAHQFTDKVERFARDNGLSIAKILKEADVVPSQWTRWRSGSSSPTLKSVERLEDAMERIEKRQRQDASQEGSAA